MGRVLAVWLCPEFRAMCCLRTGIAFCLWVLAAFLQVRSTFCGIASPGFPIHPIGFTICGMVEMQDNSFSIFLMWGVKTIIMKLGGLEHYRRYAPFFLGMIMGYIAGVFSGCFCRCFLVSPERGTRFIAIHDRGVRE